MLHFAYGSNMDRAAMLLRCPGARAIGPARLDAWRFILADPYENLLSRFLNSLLIGVGATLIVLLIGGMALYGFTRFRPSLRWTTLLLLVLAGLGLYGVLAYTVAQRKREIGVRMALGARPVQALALVARESGAVVGVGLLVGLGGALATARLFAGLLFGVGPADPIALTAAFVVLGTVALAATLLPARRAARVDPVVALRAE